MFSQLLKPHLGRIYPVHIEEVRQHQQKEMRIIDTLEPILNQHRLIIDPQVIIDDYNSAMERYPSDIALKYMMMYQLTRITKERGSLQHDDRLDALAMAVKYFLEQLDVDQVLQEKRRKEEDLDKLLDTFKNDWYDEHGTQNQGVKLWNRAKKR